MRHGKALKMSLDKSPSSAPRGSVSPWKCCLAAKLIVVVSPFRIRAPPPVLASWLPHTSGHTPGGYLALLQPGSTLLHTRSFLLLTLNNDWPSGMPGQGWPFTATRELV